MCGVHLPVSMMKVMQKAGECGLSMDSMPGLCCVVEDDTAKICATAVADTLVLGNILHSIDFLIYRLALIVVIIGDIEVQSHETIADICQTTAAIGQGSQDNIYSPLGLHRSTHAGSVSWPVESKIYLLTRQSLCAK